MPPVSPGFGKHPIHKYGGYETIDRVDDDLFNMAQYQVRGVNSRTDGGLECARFWKFDCKVWYPQSVKNASYLWHIACLCFYRHSGLYGRGNAAQDNESTLSIHGDPLCRAAGNLCDGAGDSTL